MFRVVVYSLLVAEAPTVVVIDEAVELARPTATTVLDEAEGGNRWKPLRGPSHPRDSGSDVHAVTHCGCAASQWE